MRRRCFERANFRDLAAPSGAEKFRVSALPLAPPLFAVGEIRGRRRSGLGGKYPVNFCPQLYFPLCVAPTHSMLAPRAPNLRSGPGGRAWSLCVYAHVVLLRNVGVQSSHEYVCCAPNSNANPVSPCRGKITKFDKFAFFAPLRVNVFTQ